LTKFFLIWNFKFSISSKRFLLRDKVQFLIFKTFKRSLNKTKNKKIKNRNMMKNMRSDNCLYPDTYSEGGTAYKFIKNNFKIVKINKNNPKFQHPTSFIHMIKSDEAVYMTQYHRYHDYISFDNKNTDFTKMLEMYNIFWELNKEYLTLSNNDFKYISREYNSINRVLISYFKSNEVTNYSAEDIKRLISNELINELYLRIHWEESKVLDAIRTIRSQNNDFDINKWMFKYINYESESRLRWYNFIIGVIKMSLEKVMEFSDEETVRKIMNINMNEFSIPIDSRVIYDNDKYEYMFNTDLNKIELIDGLWKIKESDILVTTANANEEYRFATSFKRIVITSEPVYISKFYNTYNNPIKKNLPRREKQMIDKFGCDIERSPLEIENSKKAFSDMVLAYLNTPKSIREKNREKYFVNISNGKISTDTNSYVSKNTNFITKQHSVSHIKIKSEKDDTRRDKIFSDKVFDIPPYMDMTRYEQVDQNRMLELKDNFVFNTVFSLGKYYMMSSTLNTISKYYKICNEKGKMIKEYIGELYNKISFDDMMNKTKNLQDLFKDGKIDADIFKYRTFII